MKDLAGSPLNLNNQFFMRIFLSTHLTKTECAVSNVLNFRNCDGWGKEELRFERLKSGIARSLILKNTSGC